MEILKNLNLEQYKIAAPFITYLIVQNVWLIKACQKKDQKLEDSQEAHMKTLEKQTSDYEKSTTLIRALVAKLKD